MKTDAIYPALLGGSRQNAGPDTLFARLCGDKNPARIAGDVVLAPLLDKLRAGAEVFAQSEITALPFSLYRLFDETGDRAAWEARYFDRRRRLVTLSLAVWLWKQPEHLAALENTIWIICDEYSWCLPAHMGGKSLQTAGTLSGGVSIEQNMRRKIDLFAAETGFALAESLAMIGGLLHPALVSRAREEVFYRVIDSFICQGEPQHWELMDNNWCAVCAGSIAGAALYLIKDDMLLAGIIRRLNPTFDRFIGSFSSDGACLEGLSYWVYGVGFYVCFADLLFHRTAGAVDLLKEPVFENIARFAQQCYFPGGATLNFSDASDGGKFRPGLAFCLAERIPGLTMPIPRPLQYPGEPGRINLAAYDDFIDHCGRFCLTLRDLLWTRAGAAQTGQIRCDALPGAQWLLCSGAGETGFAAKGGHNDEPHNHNDVGSFIFYKNGAMFLLDAGAGEYTRDYFAEGRYGYFCNRSESHNLPIIDGKGQKPGREFAAKDCVIDNSGRMSLDIAPAYGISGLAKLERRFQFDAAAGILTLRDHFVFAPGILPDGKMPNAGLPVLERFITPVEPKIEAGGFSLTVNGAECSLRCPEKIMPVVKAASYRSHGGKDATVFTVDFPFTPGGDFSIEFIIQ